MIFLDESEGRSPPEVSNEAQGKARPSWGTFSKVTILERTEKIIRAIQFLTKKTYLEKNWKQKNETSKFDLTNEKSKNLENGNFSGTSGRGLGHRTNESGFDCDF